MGLGDISRIPRFVSASTAEELQQKMLRIQVLTGREYEWRDIGFSKGKFYAWYKERESVVNGAMARDKKEDLSG